MKRFLVHQGSWENEFFVTSEQVPVIIPHRQVGICIGENVVQAFHSWLKGPQKFIDLRAYQLHLFDREGLIYRANFFRRMNG